MLCVWLPLNGDLHNQGLSNITITPGSVTVQNDGKIGKCYCPATMTLTNLGTLSFNESSYCFWAKTSATTSWQLLMGIDNTNLSQIHAIYVADSSRYKLEFHPSLNASGVEIGKWHHYAFVVKNGESKVYYDGVLKETSTETVTDDTIGRLRLGVGTAISLNDVRIYDHALSAKEVEEIAKGLVLHYKLDNNGLGGENLLANSKLDGSYTYPTSSYKDWYAPITTSIPDGDIYTLSFEAKSTVSGDKMRTHYYSPNTTTTCVSSQGITKTAADGHMDFTLSTSWTKYWVTYTQTATTAVKHIICPRLVSGQGTGTVSVRNVKLEKGPIATGWSPAKSDALYSILNVGNTIYDSSGYNNNGTIVGSLETTTPSPRYSCATHISATSSKIHISNFLTSGFGNSYSFAWWGKRNSNSPMFWGFSDGIRLNGMYLGNLWNTGDGSSNPLYKIGTTTQVAAPSVNVWHHYVMTGNGTKCYVYLDGELWAEAKIYRAINGTSVYINGWDSGTSYCSDNTDMSDFRIYATALTAGQVADLYHTSMAIDNQGNIHARELVEI